MLLLTTAVGGVEPGTFDGTIVVASTMGSGHQSAARPLATSLHFGTPRALNVSPTAVSLEQIITVDGAGSLLGGPDAPDEATVIRIEGQLDTDGGLATTFGPQDLVLRWMSGDEVQGVLDSEAQGGTLVSRLFGIQRGTFAGTAVPVAIKGTTEVEGAAVFFSLTLAPVRQVVYLHFLPGFYDSLAKFGLAASAGVIEMRVAAHSRRSTRTGTSTSASPRPPTSRRTATRPWRSAVPTRTASACSATTTRLARTWGTCACSMRSEGSTPTPRPTATRATAASSSSPISTGRITRTWAPERPTGAPNPDPLFDRLFNPVRDAPATLAEVQGTGGAARVATVQRAIDALANIVGETAAHELGHSLGLANPYGPEGRLPQPAAGRRNA